VVVDGKDEAFRRFVLAESASLLRIAWMLTGERTAAEDLLQTAFAKTWERWSRVCGDGNPGGYVRIVMVRTYSSWMGRRWRGEIPSAQVPEMPVAEGGFAAADERDALLHALAALPRRQRAAVVLRHYLDLSEQQAADALGCSVGSVKSHASRGLARLRADSALPHRTEGELR
jgi:RNA polymerase sigma-70 factor (sigma-E family)